MIVDGNCDGALTDMRVCLGWNGSSSCRFRGTFAEVVRHAQKVHKDPPRDCTHYSPDIIVEYGVGGTEWEASTAAWFPPPEQEADDAA